MQCNTMQSNRRPYNTCNTKKYHVIPYLSRLKPQLGRWGLFSQAGWFHMGCNSAGWAGCSVVMLWTPHKAIFRTQKISHKNGAMEIWDISHLGQNGPFLGPWGPRRDPIPGQKGWWPWVQPRQANGGQLGLNLVHRGPPRTSEVPKRTLYGQNGPFLPLFDRFLKLSGSIWAITVLKEQSILLRCSGHPTSLYFEKKIPTQNWPVEI